MSDDTVRQLVVHPVVWPHLTKWLESKGLAVGKLMEASDSDLETWTVTFKE